MPSLRTGESNSRKRGLRVAGQSWFKTLPRLGAFQGNAAKAQGKILTLRRQSLSSLRARASRRRQVEIRVLCTRFSRRLVALLGRRTRSVSGGCSERGGRARFGLGAHRNHECWRKAAVGSFLSKHRAENCSRSAQGSQTSGQAPTPNCREASKRGLAQVLNEIS